MADVVAIVGIIAFFAISVLYVRGCERIVGREPATTTVPTDDEALDEFAAMTESAR